MDSTLDLKSFSVICSKFSSYFVSKTYFSAGHLDIHLSPQTQSLQQDKVPKLAFLA